MDVSHLLFFVTEFVTLSYGRQQPDLCPGISKCHLALRNVTEIENKVCEWGESIPHVVEYNLRFVGRSKYEPWFPMTKWHDENITDIFKPFDYKHVFTKHGETLLSLPLKYRTLSMQAITTGVDDLSIWVEESPQNCFDNLTAADMLTITKEFFFKTLLNETWRLENRMLKMEGKKTCTRRTETICRYTLNGIRAGYECCRVSSKDIHTNCSTVHCSILMENYWLSWFFNAIRYSYYYFLLFGPLLLLRINRGNTSLHSILRYR